jgi:hypothetical protein
MYGLDVMIALHQREMMFILNSMNIQKHRKRSKQYVLPKISKSQEMHSHKVDVIIKIITPLITIAGIYIGAWEFTNQQRNNDRQEFKRKIWERQLDAYTELTSLAGNILSRQDEDTAVKRLAKEFDLVSWSNISLIDSSVEDNIIQFRDHLSDKINGVVNIDNSEILEKSAYLLSKSCRNSIQDSWKQLSQ